MRASLLKHHTEAVNQKETGRARKGDGQSQ